MRPALLLLCVLFALASAVRFNGRASVRIGDGNDLDATINVDSDQNKMEIDYDFGVFELELYNSFSRYQSCPIGECSTYVIKYPQVNWSYRTGGQSNPNINGLSVTRYTYTTDGIEVKLYVASSNRIVRVEQNGPGLNRVITFNTFNSGSASFQAIPQGCSDIQCASAVDLMLVMDTSGSINEEEFIKEKEYALEVVSRFISSSEVRVGLVTFSTDVFLDSPLTGSESAIEGAINNINPQLGLTNIGGGIEAAFNQLDQNNRDVPQVILLLTDGEANRPSPGAKSFAREKANEAKAAGVTMYVVGVGDEVNVDDLTSLATPPSDGLTYTAFVDDFEALEGTINTLLTTVCSGGDTATCNPACSGDYFCGCGSCQCTITECPNDGTITNSCTCACTEPYTADCSSCARVCENGRSLSDCSCDCNGDWEGDTCSSCPWDAICTNENQRTNGDCTGCECTGDWTGATCEECNRNCNTGTFSPDCLSCVCTPPRSGPRCTGCDLVCANGGTKKRDCSGCNCPAPFKGPLCAECDTSNRSYCSDRGTVNNPGTGCNTCSCDSPWSGQKCETCSFNCNLHGDPNLPGCNSCTCRDAYNPSDNCATCNTANRGFCNNHGNPSDDPVDNCAKCVCDEDTLWSGDKCNECDFECHDGNHNGNCNGCLDCGTTNWSGDDCTVCDETINRVYCTSHGRINNANGDCNVCECDDDWSGDHCELCIYECNDGTQNTACNGCSSCPGGFTTESDCLECDATFGIDYCNGRGSISNPKDGCDVCECEPAWQGDETCSKCIYECNGGTVVDCTSCIDCPGAYLEIEDCAVCDESNPSPFCNDRGFVNLEEGDCNECVCDPALNYGGATCSQCQYTCPNGSSHNENCDGCDCSSDSAFIGNDCNECDVSDGSDFCNGRGFVSNPETGCNECECNVNDWEGDRCEECNFTCNGHGSPSDECDVCECTGQFDPTDDCQTCLLVCGEHSHPNDACTLCECDDRYAGQNCDVCDPAYASQCANDATISTETDCFCDCANLFSGEFCEDCVAEEIDCGEQGVLTQVLDSSGNPTCECECAEYVVGEYCEQCGLEEGGGESCSGIAEPNFGDCTCNCPQYYENTEGCQICILVPEDCVNGGGNPDTDKDVCACECPEPWTGRDCSVCPEDLCGDVEGVYRDPETCTCYTICEDGYIAGDEECEQVLQDDPKDHRCCVECRLVEQRCNDRKFCTTNDFCSPEGVCLGGETTICSSDNDPCTTDLCDAEQDKCVYETVDDNTPCDDGDPCTENDVCVAGECAGTPLVCDEHADNPCIEDFCEDGVCQFRNMPQFFACDDGNKCTARDVCDQGTCVPGAPVICRDTDPCLDNRCVQETGECQQFPHNRPDTLCDDGDICTSGDLCVAGECVGSPLCQVNDPCLTGICDQTTGECSTFHNNNACDDGRPCTRNDLCVNGECLGEEFECLDDGNPCTDPFCALDGTCGFIAANDDAPCDDGNACTIGDACVRGICRGLFKCERDNDPCTDDSCDPETGECLHVIVASGVDCDDGDQCTVNDICDFDGCRGELVICKTDNECLKGECKNGDCQFTPTGGNEPCDDGNPCTVDDVCVGRRCKGVERDCSTDDKCFIGTCDATTGDCKLMPAVTCEPRNTCESARCVEGKCEYVADVCDDFNACTDDMCVDGKCVFKEVVCPQDDSVCTKSACVDDNGVGVCKETTFTCEDRQGGCQIGKCDDVLGCQYFDKDCDDGLACTKDACVNGDCVHTQIICGDDDDDQCTIPFCEAGECLNRDRECGDDDDGADDDSNDDDDDCQERLCLDGECITRNNCTGVPPVVPPIVVPPSPVQPPTQISEEPSTVTPAPARTRNNSTAAAANAGARPLTQDEAAEVLTSVPVNLVATGLASGGVVVIFLGGLVLAFNNSKQKPPAPAIASLIDVEMTNAAHENPVFVGQADANLNILNSGA